MKKAVTFSVIAVLSLAIIGGIAHASGVSWMGLISKLMDSEAPAQIIYNPDLYLSSGSTSKGSTRLAGSGTQSNDGSVKFDAPIVDTVIALNNFNLETQGLPSGQSVTLRTDGDIEVLAGTWGYYTDSEGEIITNWLGTPYPCPHEDLLMDPVDQSSAGGAYPDWAYIGSGSDPDGRSVVYAFVFYPDCSGDETSGSWVGTEVWKDDQGNYHSHSAMSKFNSYSYSGQ